GISVTKMEINPKNLKLVMDEEQMVIEDITDIGYPAAYGSLFMEPIVGGIVNTCEMQLEFTVSSWCVSIGCFGGSPQYTLWKDAGGIMEPNNLQSKIPVNKLNKKVN
ncbi:MAG: hypothetical protein JXB49_01215, partial [Bacteroidales bacterium]|nr:hypothetical protein [Bacteroidales bacterium]